MNTPIFEPVVQCKMTNARLCIKMFILFIKAYCFVQRIIAKIRKREIMSFTITITSDKEQDKE